MGWACCGNDSKGRPIGYAHEATCDEPGCDAEIDRGLAYACGGMHGEDEWSCEGYFCSEHLVYSDIEECKYPVCRKCAASHGEDGKTSLEYPSPDEAIEAAWTTWGSYPATPSLYDGMCYWLQGWYFVRGWRVSVTWRPYMTHRVKFEIRKLGEVDDG